MASSPIKMDLKVSTALGSMPKGWKSPMREDDGTPKKLYGVVVETRQGLVRVGPAMLREIADEFRSAIVQQIVAGRETQWTNPSVVCMN